MSYTKPLSIVCIVVSSFALPAVAFAQHRGGGGGHAAGAAGPRGAVVAGPRGAVVAGPRGAVVAGHGYPGYPVYGYGHPRYVYPRVVGVYPYHPYYYPYRPGITVGFYAGFGVGFGYGYPYYGYGYPYPYYGYPYPYPYSYYPYASSAPPGYPYASSAPPAPTSYVTSQPGVAYGGVRIEGAPRDAQIFVDGNYIGLAEDFDGADKHLNLPAGSHQIEIRVAGAQPIAFDVNVQAGRTTAVHADVR